MQNNNQKFIPILVVLILIGGIYYSNRDEKKETIQVSDNNINQTINMVNVLEVTDLVIGKGEEAKAGQRIIVNYIGTLVGGKKFDSSYDRGEPFSFTLGGGEVIRGWDEGLVGMKVGGKRRLVIPPDFGYGARDIGGGLIPPNSTLIFEVEFIGTDITKQ